MSFFKKLFGAGKKEEVKPQPEEKLSPPTPAPPPKLDLSKADQPVDCTGIDWNEAEQLEFVNGSFKKTKESAAFQKLVSSDPFAGNSSLSTTDAAVLYAMASGKRPGRIMEVGGGYSTLVLNAAKVNEDLPGELITIDPTPEIDIFELVDAHIADPIQQVPVDDFEILMPGEMVILNTSHIDTPGSDVEYLYDKILPALTSGVIIGIHGIKLPRNYGKEELEKGYNEQDRVLELLKQDGKMDVLYAGAWLKENNQKVEYTNSTFLWCIIQ